MPELPPPSDVVPALLLGVPPTEAEPALDGAPAMLSGNVASCVQATKLAARDKKPSVHHTKGLFLIMRAAGPSD
jgi:hypothetical protein